MLSSSYFSPSVPFQAVPSAPLIIVIMVTALKKKVAIHVIVPLAIQEETVMQVISLY